MKSKRKSANCIIKDIVYGKRTIEFVVKEESLPFPVVNDAKPALVHVPFTDLFNKEILQVDDIPPGEYQLFIDNIQIGTYPSHTLKTGINLALTENTPQYRQSAKIMGLYAEYQKTQAKYRNIIGMEIYILPDSLKDVSIDIIEGYLDKYLVKKSLEADEWHKSQFKSYLSNKLIQTEIEKRLPEIIETVYLSNKPAYHSFRLKKTN